MVDYVIMDRSLIEAAIREIRTWKVDKGGDDQVVLNLEASLANGDFGIEEDPELSRTCYRGKTVEGGEIVLVHWPEGYRLRYHGETVWREPDLPKPDLTAN